jgi:hypothetical protein
MVGTAFGIILRETNVQGFIILLIVAAINTIATVFVFKALKYDLTKKPKPPKKSKKSSKDESLAPGPATSTAPTS